MSTKYPTCMACATNLHIHFYIIQTLGKDSGHSKLRRKFHYAFCSRNIFSEVYKESHVENCVKAAFVQSKLSCDAVQFTPAKQTTSFLPIFSKSKPIKSNLTWSLIDISFFQTSDEIKPKDVDLLCGILTENDDGNEL